MLIAHLIPVLRSVVLVFWAIVAMWSRESLWRTLRRQGDSGDHKEAALVITGAAIIGFQAQALWGAVGPRTDLGTATFLAVLAIPPLMICWLVQMSLLGRLLMIERPVLASGGRYILDTGDDGVGWVIRLQMLDHLDSRLCPVVGPRFTVLEKAGEYREWFEGTREHFDYGTGPV